MKISVWQFVKDRSKLLSFFLVNLLLTATMIQLDHRNRMLTANLLYIAALSLFLLTCYLTLDYLRQRSYLSRLGTLAQSNLTASVHSLPEPSTLEQELMQHLLGRLAAEQDRALLCFSNQAKEDMEFITAWVHEIKTPIAVSKLVIEHHLNRPTEKTLLSLEEEIERIEDYVQKALYYTRINDFSNDYVIADVALHNLVMECVRKQSKGFIAKQIRIELEEFSLEVSTDRKWLGFIFDQIISNGLKYTSRDGFIRISAVRTEAETVVRFEDTGVGIGPEDLGRIFAKSFTGANGRTQNGSTGIGLYLSQKLAKKLGHHLSVDSVPGQGTQVAVHFPKWTDYFDVTKM